MMNNPVGVPYFQGMSFIPHEFLLPFVGSFFIFTILIVVWSLYWKGKAMWIAARQGDKNWFIVLLLVHTIGILDLLYVHFFSQKEVKIEKVETTS